MTEREIEEALVELRPLLTKVIAQERVGAQSWLLEDAEQEAMIAAWTRLAEGHSMGIAVHNAKQAVVDLLRGGRTTGSKQAGVNLGVHVRAVSLVQPTESGSEEYLLEPADPGAQAAYEDLEEQAALDALLAPLTPEQRSLVHRRMDGLTVREIAAQEGVSHQAISLRISKIRRALQPLYEAAVA